MKVTVIVEKNNTNLFSVYVENDLPDFALNGQGQTIDEAKAEMLLAYEEIKELLKEDGKEAPVIEFEYKYDIPSLFTEFNMINISKFAESIGINSGLMRRYACGEIYASEKQLKKIRGGLHSLSEKLKSAMV